MLKNIFLRVMQTGNGEICYRLDKEKWTKGAGKYRARSFPCCGHTVFVQFPKSISGKVAYQAAENYVSGWIARGKPALEDEVKRLYADARDIPF